MHGPGDQALGHRGTRLQGAEAAESAMHYVAPVGEQEEYVARALRNVTPDPDPVHS